MKLHEIEIPTLHDECTSLKHEVSINELDKQEVPFSSTIFNTCTRSGNDRRVEEGKPSHRSERRSGRDRRLYSLT